MSIRLLALELYRAKKNVESLQKELEQTTAKDAGILADQLREAVKEYEVIRKMFEAKKTAGSTSITSRYYRGMK